MDPAPTPFQVNIANKELDDLKKRIQNARLPDALEDAGTQSGEHTEFLTYFKTDEVTLRVILIAHRIAGQILTHLASINVATICDTFARTLWDTSLETVNVAARFPRHTHLAVYHSC